MPGFDRSGPVGAGPLTGGGRGRCNPASAGSVTPPASGYGRGLALRRGFRGGNGRGMGAGRGYGRGYGWYPTAAETIAPVEPADEMDMLKAEADDMRKMLETINSRIRSIEEKFAEKS